MVLQPTFGRTIRGSGHHTGGSNSFSIHQKCALHRMILFGCFFFATLVMYLNASTLRTLSLGTFYSESERQHVSMPEPYYVQHPSLPKEALPTPAWWIESDPDDSFERIYLDMEEKKRYKNLRNLGSGGIVTNGTGIKRFFNPMCRHYRFNETKMPTVSVIMTSQNEPDDWVSLSVQSLLARTPPSLLKEVIVFCFWSIWIPVLFLLLAISSFSCFHSISILFLCCR